MGSPVTITPDQVTITPDAAPQQPWAHRESVWSNQFAQQHPVLTDVAKSFDIGNVLKNAWQGATGIAKAGKAVGSDLISNPNWVAGCIGEVGGSGPAPGNCISAANPADCDGLWFML